MLALETHVEKPDESGLFAQFPSVTRDHHVLEFLCDYLRMMTLGTENPHELESLIDEEMETHHHEANQVSRDRKRGEKGKSVSVRVDLGGRRIIKKKKKQKKEEILV